MPAAKGKKLKTSVALDIELLKWVDEQVKKGTYYNRTHAIEQAIRRLKENEQN
jgi:Arc/MetJ-type ribon-helix-helix transcriptional regulator